MASGNLFIGIHAIILEPGLGKARKKVLCKKLEEKGGVFSDTYSSAVTHVFVGSNMKYTRVLTLLKVSEINKSIQILQADWISKCLTEAELVDTSSYAVKPEVKAIEVAASTTSPLKTDKLDHDVKQPPTEDKGQPLAEDKGQPLAEDKDKAAPTTGSSAVSTPTKSPQKLPRALKRSPGKMTLPDSSDSDYVNSDEEPTEIVEPPPVKKLKGRWVCDIPSSSGQPVNHNKHITDKLKELLQFYKNSPTPSDQWRVMGYNKAISALKNHPKEITTWEEAKSLPAVGKRLADKIWEIVSSGHLRRLDHIDEKESVTDMFGKIWGVGPTCAQRFVALGYCTLDELRASGELNRQQLIGLAHYDEFLERMPREEAAEIEQKVKEAAVALCPGVVAIACGSYRRGKKDCGDVDVLVTHPDGRSHKGLYTLLLQRLRATGFITDDLTVQEDHGGQTKYLGVCKLPGEGRKHRRLDIIVVPYSEYPCALVYFTGSGRFNRSMRLKARKLGMALSEHSLRKDLIRKGTEKLFEGTPVPVFSEEDVFKHLGMDYFEPHDRNWD